MISIREQLSCLVVKGVGENPIRRVVGYQITNPLYMVQRLAFSAGVIVFRVDDALD